IPGERFFPRRMRMLSTRWTTIIVGCVAVFGIVAVTGCNRGPRPVVSNVTRQEHPEMISGELDWGSEVSFDVANNGEPGIVLVEVVLSSSEGEWSRTQKVMLGQGELRRLTY